MKPVKSFFSIFAARIDSQEQYNGFIRSYRKHSRKFAEPLNILLKKYSSLKINADYLIAEKLMNGQQVTLEGYVYNKKIEVLGITDSIKHVGTISFKRFEYPSSLGKRILDRMAEIAKVFISSIGFDNGILNIEFFYDPEARIEIYGKEGARLSEHLQDMQSYRYGIINLGGNTRQELNDKFEQCGSLLKFNFKNLI